MHDDLPPDIQRAVTAVQMVLGTAFSFAMLVDFVAAMRTKQLRIEEDHMPAGMTGYCVALQDLDLICTRTGLDSMLKRAAQLHELSHLLLGHIPRYSNGVATPLYATFVARRDMRHVVHRNHTTAYDAPQEHDAELLATHLLKGIHQYETNIPDIAHYLHG